MKRVLFGIAAILAFLCATSRAQNLSAPNIVASNSIRTWGDSLTSGNQDHNADNYPNYLNLDLYRPVFNYGVGGYTSTQILSLYNATPAQALNDVQVIWSGRNDLPTTTTPLANIASMVAAIPAPKRYVVMSVINTEEEPTGSANNIAALSLNASLASTYPNNYIDINSLLIAQAGVTAGDVYNAANGMVPLSLRAVLSSGTVTAAVSSTSTCAISLSASGAATDGILTIDSEYIRITGVSGNNVTTCTRGYKGSTAATHSSGAAYTVRDSLHLGATGYAFVATQVANFIKTHYPAPGSQRWMDGLSSVMLGLGAMDNSSGTRDVAIGMNDLNGSGLNDDNNVIGYSSLLVCTTCQTNNVLGGVSMDVATTAKGNSAVGYNDLAALTTGNYNSVIGQTSCNLITTGSNNSCFGTSSGVAAAADHATVVGAGATSTCSSCVTLGRTSDDVYEPKNTSFPVLGTDSTGKHVSVAVPMSCQPGLGDGLNAIPAGTYLTTTCKNDTGQTWTLTSIKCVADAGSSTCNATNGAGTGLLTGAVTGTSTYATGTQSSTVTIASGDYLKVTFVADGTTKQIGIDVAGTW